MFAGLPAASLSSLENIDFLVLTLECLWLSPGSLPCRVLKVNIFRSNLELRIKWLWKPISVAPQSVSAFQASLHAGDAGSIENLHRAGEATWHHAVSSWALPSACPVPLSPEEQSNLCSLHPEYVFSQKFHGRAGCAATGGVLLPELQHLALENRDIRMKLLAINCRY